MVQVDVEGLALSSLVQLAPQAFRSLSQAERCKVLAQLSNSSWLVCMYQKPTSDDFITWESETTENDDGRITWCVAGCAAVNEQR